jgi:protein-arginine kinase activator protein McsA
MTKEQQFKRPCQRCREAKAWILIFNDPDYPDVEVCGECALKEISERKAIRDASNDLRQVSAATGAATSGSDGQEQAESSKTPCNRSPEGREKAQEQGQNDRALGTAEKATPEVSGGSEGVLEGRVR